MNENEQHKFDQLSKQEQRAAVIWALAARAEEAPEKIRSIESAGEDAKEQFIDFARDYFDLFDSLASETRSSQNTARVGETYIAITKTRPSEPKAVSVFVESLGNETKFQLPDPDLLASNNNQWSSDSMPIGRSTLAFDGVDNPLTFDFSLMRRPGVESYAHFATSIAFAAEVLVLANSPEEVDLRD